MNPQNVLMTADFGDSVEYGSLSSLHYGLRTPYEPVDERNVFEKTGDFITGIPRWAALSASSAVIGLANTIPAVANAVGGKGTLEYLSTLNFAASMDEAFDTGTSMQDFYAAHSSGIELTGALVGGIVPGLAAVKGARLISSGLTPYVSKLAAMESDHIVGKSAAWVAGLVDTNSKTNLLRSSYASLISGNNAASKLLSMDALKYAMTSSVTVGAEALVFEAGSTLAQMHNPTYSDIKSLGDFTSHLGTAAVFGGALGGLVSPFLRRSASFLPSDLSIAPTTLRETRQVVGQAEQNVLAVKDFGQLLNSIPSGSKVSALADDLAVTEDDLFAAARGLSDFVPADMQELSRKTITEWITRRDANVESAIREEVAKLTKSTKDSVGIGEDLLRAMVRDADGNLIVNPEKISQVLSGASSVGKLTVSTKGTAGLQVVDNTMLGEEQAKEFSRVLMESPAGKQLASINARKEEIKELLALEGYKLTTKLTELPEMYQAPVREHRSLNKVINSQEAKILTELLENPKSYKDAHGQLLKLSPEARAILTDMVDPKMIQSVRHVYDMQAGQFTSKPSAVLGDLINSADELKVIGGNVQIDKQILTRDYKALIASSEAPKSSLDAQLAWEMAKNTIQPKSGNKLRYENIPEGETFFSTGDYNPFRLAAAIDKGIELPISKEAALQELTKAKFRMFDHGIKSGMSETEARLYADLPATERLSEWSAKVGSENNFLKRRHVEVAFNAETQLSEMELKTIAGVRTEIFGQQLRAAEAVIDAAADAGIKIPDVVRSKLAGLREFGLSGANPIDFANAGNAGALVNASGRMLRLNTDIQQLGAFVNHLITREHESILQTLAPEFQRILRGTTKHADLDALAVVHKKITGGGNKWYDLSVVMGGGDSGELVYVSKEVASLFLKGTDAALSKAAELLDDTKHSFTVDNPNVASLLRAYSDKESIYRKATLKMQAAKGYNVPDNIPGQLYFPPLDITRSPYFVMVRSDSDAAIGGLSKYSFVHANSSEALAKKVEIITREMGPTVKIYSKRDLGVDKLLAGEFEQAKTFYSYSIDSELASKGVFSEYLPRSGEELLSEMQNHLRSSASSVVRNSITSSTGDFMGTLDRLAHSMEAFSKSTHGKAFGPGSKGVTPDNIYSQMQRTLLDIGPDENASGILGLATGIQNKVVEWSDMLFDRARALAINASVTSPGRQEELIKRVNDIVEESKRIGVDFSHMNVALLQEAEQRFGRGYVTRGITQTLNSLSAMLTLGIELMNPLVQSISLPITINSAIRQLLADAPPQIKDQLKSIGLSWKSARLLGRADMDFWKDVTSIASHQKVLKGQALTGEELTKYNAWRASKSGQFFDEMEGLGLMPSTSRQFMVEIGEVTDLKDFSLGALKSKLIKAAELATTVNRYSELRQRYAALRIADGIAEAAGITGDNRLNLLHSFSTQANGVYTAAQRPGLFQGALGSTFGLYKSYSINLLQAMGRHIENRDYKALLSVGAVQGSIFGARSIPGAEQLNAYIHAQNKEDERDLYTTAQMVLGEGAGNALLYGLPSMFLNANLYSRGDIRPNSIIGNPLNIENFAAVNQFVNAGKAVSNALSKAASGAPIGSVMLDALAHQSLWRPGARVAEYALGKQTSAQGNVIQNVGEATAPIWGWNLAVRLAGARPFDEAVLSDSYYRQVQYKTEHSQAMRALTAATRLTISQRGVEGLDYDELSQKFMREGGTPKEFRRWIRGLQSGMTITEAERMKNKLTSSGNVEFAQQFDIPQDPL